MALEKRALDHFAGLALPNILLFKRVNLKNSYNTQKLFLRRILTFIGEEYLEVDRFLANEVVERGQIIL